VALLWVVAMLNYLRDQQVNLSVPFMIAAVGLFAAGLLLLLVKPQQNTGEAC
jgi:hypothetical protein